jgi:hypothetical protein
VPNSTKIFGLTSLIIHAPNGIWPTQGLGNWTDIGLNEAALIRLSSIIL